jgi:hypothetical protein
MHSLQRMRAITTQYTDLQGLARIPTSLFVIVFMALGPWMDTHGLGCLHVLLLAGLFMAWLWGLDDHIRAYYHRAFGRIVPQDEPERHGKATLLGRVGRAGALIVGIVIVGHLILPEWLPLPIYVGLLGCSAGLIVKGWRSNGLQNHYVILGLGGAIVSVLPLLGIISMDDYYQTTNLAGLLVRAVPGLLLVLGDLCDHLVLMRLMKPIAEENYGRDH